MIPADLPAKTVLITGGGSGIGLAATTLFARGGATVAANVLPGDDAAIARIERLAADGLAVFAVPGDVAAPDKAKRMVGDAIARLGRLDVLINNAGTINTREPIDFADLGAMTAEFWDTILSTNLVGPFVCAAAAADALKAARGAIVNPASVAGLGLRGSSIAYAASKAGLVTLTRGLARARPPTVPANPPPPAPSPSPPPPPPRP